MNNSDTQFKKGNASPRKGRYKPIKNLVGEKFNRWTVVSFSRFYLRKRKTPRYKNGESDKINRWICRCECGNIKEVMESTILHGTSKSCGCLQKEVTFNNRLPDLLTHKKRIFYRYKKQAIERNIGFNLKFNFFTNLLSQNCYYCASPPQSESRSHGCKEVFFYNGIDRLDNDKGYTDGNVVPCCKSCNVAKADMRLKDFFALIERIYNVHIAAS